MIIIFMISQTKPTTKNQSGMAIFEHLIIIMIIAIMGLAGYRVYQSKQDSPNKNSHGKSELASTYQTPKDLQNAHDEFGLNLIKSLSKKEAKNNFFISPAGISLALSMAYNGANSTTKDEMTRVLQLKNLSTSELNQQSLGLIKILNDQSSGVEISAANSLWYRQSLHPKNDFISNVKTFYQAEALALDFNSPAAADQINSWVNQKTKGKIPTIVDQVNSDSMMFLINAMYFKGEWSSKFNEKLTENKDFHSSSSAKQNRPFMYRHDKMSYLETSDFQSVVLPYGKSGDFRMEVFLPKNLQSFVASLDLNNWSKWLASYQDTEGTLWMPKFKATYEKELNETLKGLGMKTAFEDNADFSGIDKNLKISKVKHKSYIDVDEKGTEAAAITSVEIVELSATAEPVKKKTFYMEVNQPFFYAITDSRTQEILFAGVTQNL